MLSSRLFLFLNLMVCFGHYVSALPLFQEKISCTLQRDCSPLTNLIETKKLHYGTRALLTLLLCSYTDGKIYVKCISQEKTNSFMEKAELLPDYNDCGIENVDSKISGGEITGLDEHPWVALLKYRNDEGVESYGCHGNLISQRYVLTAAHCVNPDPKIIKNRNVYSVVLGEYDLTKEKDCVGGLNGQDCGDKKEIKVEKYHIHPDYDNKTFANDIALIRMEEAVEYSDFIKPICLPPVNLIDPAKETLWIAGWGTTDIFTTNPIKVKAKFRLQPLTDCIQRNVNINITVNQYCAISDGKAKTCPGDSGGPLMMTRKIQDNFYFYLVGVYSLGVIRCVQDLPLSIYSKVHPYIEWIITTLDK